MPFRSKAHWTAILAIGLPLIISGCAQTDKPSSAAPTATAAQPRPAPTTVPSNVNAMTLAQDLEADGNYANAAVMYQQAYVSNPQNIDAMLGMADSYLAIGSLDQAALAYAQALEMDPNNSRALRGLASARIMKGEPQFAIAHLQKAVQINPKDHKAMNTLGVTQDMMGQHAAAQANYRKVLKDDPKNHSAKNNLALSLALTGNTDESIRLLEEIGASTRSTPISKQNLALVYAAAGRTEDAMMLAQSGAAAGTVQQVAAIYSAGSEADKRVLLRRAFGIEFKGTQFVTPNQQIAVISHVDETSPYTEGVVNIATGPQKTQAPTIINVKTNTPSTASTTASKTKPAGKVADEDWAEDWDEELVDAADLAALPDDQPGKTDSNVASDDDSVPPKPTATAATATVTAVTPAKDGKDDTAALPMANAGPVAPSEPAKTEKPVQVAEAKDHAAGSITKSAGPAEPPSDSTIIATTPPAIDTTPAKPSSTPKPAASEPMVKTSQTPAPSSAPANASTPSKDIQVAALPPATATSTPATKTTTIANGATVTEQSVNAAKIYTVQIASFRKEGDAAASWQMLKTEQADLAALPHHVEKADLGKDKGIYYRLQAGSFANMEDAKSLCTSLKKRAIECMVVETKQVSMNSAPASTQPATSVQ